MRTWLWHGDILNLDVKVGALVDDDTGFASLGNVERLHFLFSHGSCLVVCELVERE